MKLINLKAAVVFFLIMLLSACDITRAPFDGVPPEEALAGVEGVQNVTRGNYAFLKDLTGGTNNLVMMMYQSGDYRSDDLMISGTTSNRMMLTYNYLHNPDMPNTLNLWRQGYQLIYNTNTVIDAVSPGESAQLDQLLGENYFLRGMMHLYIAKGFARPYSHGTSNLGIPYMREPDVNARPARESVGDTYNYIVQDLTQAYQLMNESKSSSFGSAEAAMALLSRVYLYMENNQAALEYADRVINSGRYQLIGTNDYPSYFTMSNETRSESIFAIHHTAADDHGRGHGIGSMYFERDGSGWGENYASGALRELLDQWPTDVRRQFIEPQYILDDNGEIQYHPDGRPVMRERNGFPRYYVTKFVGPEGALSLSHPELIRYTEIYLNKAEALAKLGREQEALDIVNQLRTRANIPSEGLYSLSNLGNHSSVLDVVLEERRLELFFEGHRAHDLFRNNKTMFRNYRGTHLAPGNPGVEFRDDLPALANDLPALGTQTIGPDHPRIIWYIPESEIDVNPNLVQNPN
ncbi:MAG: RagB/SusD family nutrient uptake outer membrane protein [Balneolaceae bacterium]|nr:RagB/SusD family nutrient uptake outer membrane protein [Balneolaceae bacterium]